MFFLQPPLALKRALPAPTQRSAVPPQEQLLQVLQRSQLTQLLRAAAVPPEPQRTVRAGLRTPHRQGTKVETTSVLQASRAQAGHLGSSGLLGEAAGHPILMEEVVVVAGVEVAAAAALREALATPTGSASM